ncbi:MAG: hypothetical protein IJ295_02635 [Clostridia bacterium]|nr:hypothetical protein [Clostridia bacterium]
MGMMAQLLAEEEYTGAQFIKELSWLITIIISIAGALMTLYAVYIGYLFATASDEGKRKAAKNRLIKILSSALIIFALASCISVINVTFDNAKVNNPSENSSLTVTENTYLLNKEKTPVLKLEQGRENCIHLYGENIYIKDGDYLSGASVVFTGFSFVDGSNLTNYCSPAEQIKIKTDVSKLEYNFYCTSASSGVGTIQCYKKDDKYYAIASASFNYGNLKGCVVKFLVELKAGRRYCTLVPSLGEPPADLCV